MRFNKILPKILLIAGFFILYLVIRYQSNIREAWQFNLEKVKIYFDNFFFESSSRRQRRRPWSLDQKETELKLYIGEPFRSFSRKDWNDFWQLIYGAFPKEEPGKQGLPKKMRQLTLDEISFELMDRYPQPFGFFRENHWKIFFGIILQK